MRTRLLLLAACLGWTALAGAATPPERSLHELGCDPNPQPVLPWPGARDGGRLRALFICSRFTREPEGLAQRLPLRYQLAPLSFEGGWITHAPALFQPGLDAAGAASRLGRLLREPLDVILLGACFWKDVLPPELRYAILERVHGGAGLVYVWPRDLTPEFEEIMRRGAATDGHYILGGTPLAALPALAGLGDLPQAEARMLRLATLGKGRIALLTYPQGPVGPWSLTPNPSADPDTNPLWQEYHYAFLARATQWAAQRAPSAYVRTITVAPSRPDADRWDGVRLEVRLAAQPGGGESLRVVCHDNRNRVLGEVRQPARLENSLPLPPLPAGVALVDCWLERGGALVDFASAAVTVEAQQRIAGVHLAQPSYRPGQAVAGRVAFSGPTPASRRLCVFLQDDAGRVLAARDYAVRAGSAEMAFRIPLRAPLTLRCTAIAELRQGGRLVHRAERAFYVQLPSRDDFQFINWDSGGDAGLCQRSREALRRWHTDTHDTGGWARLADGQLEQLAAADLRALPYVTRYFSDGSCGRNRNPCLSDPAYQAAEAAHLAKRAAICRDFAPLAYTLGDENALTCASPPVEQCACPLCRAAFSTYARRLYGSIEAANREWGTSYRGFDEAIPLTLVEARTRGNSSQWVDYRLFMESTFVAAHRRGRSATRARHPGALVGLDGAFDTNSWSGYDWPRLCSQLDLVCLYPYSDMPHQVEAVRSFQRPRGLTGIWYGGYPSDRFEHMERGFPWFMAFHDMNSAWWFASWSLNPAPSSHAAIAPDLSPYLVFAQTAAEIAVLRAGFAKLLQLGRRHNDGIAVHYSQRSLHVAAADGRFASVPAAQRSWEILLEDLGFQYDVVSEDQVEQGALVGRGFKVLVLPLSLALSAREASQIARFVARGGILLTDVLPGAYDEHGKARPHGALDAVFGVSQRTAGVVKGVGARWRATFGGKSVQGACGVDGPVPCVEIQGARSLGRVGDVPAVLTHGAGMGRALLLNFPISGYGGLVYGGVRTPGEMPALRPLIAAFLRAGGVRPGASVEVQGRTPSGVELARYRLGAQELLAVLPCARGSDTGPLSATLRFPVAHVYDSRAGRYLGRVGRVAALWRAGPGRVYARLPYRVRGVTVSAARSRLPAGTDAGISCRVRSDGSLPGTHVLRMRVYDPAGMEQKHYALNIVCSRGSGRASIPFALSDTPGRWTVTVQDVATGRRGQAALQISRPTAVVYSNTKRPYIRAFKAASRE